MAKPELERSISEVDEKGNVEHIGSLKLSHVSSESELSGGRGVKQVKSAALAAALASGQQTKAWTKDAFLLYICCLVAFLSSCANGYDGSLMTAINGMPFYQNKFNSGTTGSTTGIIFAMYTIGQMIGCWSAGPVTDKFGRRGGMFIGGIIVIIGVAIISSSNHKSQLLAGRFFLGWGVCILTTAAPSYCVEICPPQWRGRMTGFYNCGWFGGSIPAAAITYGTQFIHSDLSWRLPLIFQAVPSGFVVLTVWFLPESPRWLMAHGKSEEAKAFLIRFHGNGDPTNPIVDLEWAEFQESIALDASDKRWWDYSGLFGTANARWRSLMMILMGVFGQFSGNGLGYFNTVIYQNLGYTSSATQLLFNLLGSITSAVGALGGVIMTDIQPRRTVLVWGTFASACMLAINAGLSTAFADNQTSKKLGQGSLAAYFLFGVVYSYTYTPLQALYPVECLETTARAKGMAMYAFVVNAVSFINTYAGPIALHNIKNNYIWVFVGWDMVEALLWYLLCIETNGRTLEELQEIFSAPNPIAASKRSAKVIVKDNNEVAVVDE